MEFVHLKPTIHPDNNKLETAYEVIDDIQTQFADEMIRVPKFFQYDGASIPSPVWQLIGSPFHPRFMTAAVFHDWLYHTHQIKRAQADKLFHEFLLASGIGKTKAVLMCEAVKNFGHWYWKNDKDDDAYLERLADRIQQDGRNPADYGLP